MYTISLQDALPILFFFNDTATTEIYTLSLHDALPISAGARGWLLRLNSAKKEEEWDRTSAQASSSTPIASGYLDRKSTRLNSSHANISYAVFCLKKKLNKTRLNSSHANTSSAVFVLNI